MFNKKMTKKQAIKKIEKIIKDGEAKIIKEIESVLASAKVWYSKTDTICEYDELHKKNDHNGDQLVVDFAADIVSGNYSIASELKEEHLWTEEDIKSNKQN